MKKWLLILGIITCMAGLAACGQKEQTDAANLMKTEEVESLTDSMIGTFEQVIKENNEAAFIAAFVQQSGWDATMLGNAFESLKSASGDMGDYVKVIEVIDNSMIGITYDNNTYPVDGKFEVRIQGTKHNAIVEIIYEDEMPISISTNVEYTFAENMEKAGLNTLLGMGTVFVVLILISLIISAFGLIAKVQSSQKKPEEEKKVDKVVSQIVEKEELSDDLELVAVISAAIAAYEGSGSTDGFVVRSIRKAYRK